MANPITDVNLDIPDTEFEEPPPTYHEACSGNPPYVISSGMVTSPGMMAPAVQSVDVSTQLLAYRTYKSKHKQPVLLPEESWRARMDLSGIAQRCGANGG